MITLTIEQSFRLPITIILRFLNLCPESTVNPRFVKFESVSAGSMQLPGYGSCSEVKLTSKLQCFGATLSLMQICWYYEGKVCGNRVMFAQNYDSDYNRVLDR